MADRYPVQTPPPSTAALGRLLSPRVAGSRYVFLNLAPAPRTTWAMALAGREQTRPDYVVDRSAYPFHVVELVVRGTGASRIGGGKRHLLASGTVFSCAPDQPCYLRSDADAPLEKFFFALAGTEVRARLAAAGLPPGAVRHVALPSELIASAEEIVREGQRHHPAAAEICLKIFELLLLRLKVAQSSASLAVDERARESFLRCKAIIDADAAKLLTLEELAAQARLAPSTICRLFRRFQGISPYRYLMRRKMTLAAGILLEEASLVKEAAARVGFEDPYHFSRCFKSVHGVAPNALRELAQSAGN